MGRSHNPHFHPTVFIRFLVLTIFISSILGSENVSLTTTNHGHLQFVVETRPRSVHILAAALVQSHYYRSYDRTKPSGHRRSSKAGTEHRLFTFVSRIPSTLSIANDNHKNNNNYAHDDNDNKKGIHQPLRHPKDAKDGSTVMQPPKTPANADYNIQNQTIPVHHQLQKSFQVITENPKRQFGDWILRLDSQARSKVQEVIQPFINPKEAPYKNFHEKNKESDPKESNKSYQFGDFSKGLYHKFGDSVNTLTGKADYEFGDLTRWLDAHARSTVEDLMHRSESSHHGSNRRDGFHRHSEFHSSATLTGLFRLFRSLLLAQIIKIVIEMGWERQVLTKLPIKLLMDLLKMCVAQPARPKIIRVVAMELDKRIKSALVGDVNYQFGDLTKRSILRFTGKSTYQFGDITRTLLEKSKHVARHDDKAWMKKASRHNEQIHHELHLLDVHVKSLQDSPREHKLHGRIFSLPLVPISIKKLGVRIPPFRRNPSP